MSLLQVKDVVLVLGFWLDSFQMFGCFVIFVDTFQIFGCILVVGWFVCLLIYSGESCYIFHVFPRVFHCFVVISSRPSKNQKIKFL